MLETIRRPTVEVLLVAMLALGACDDGGDDSMESAADSSSQPFSCADETRADAFAVDLSKMDATTTVTIVDAVPAEPVRGDNTWIVRLTDASGSPLAGASLDVKPWMPDHGHGSPVEEQITELEGGEYEITSLNLFMAGYWEVTIELSEAEGGAEAVMFALCVD